MTPLTPLEKHFSFLFLPISPLSPCRSLKGFRADTALRALGPSVTSTCFAACYWNYREVWHVRHRGPCIVVDVKDVLNFVCTNFSSQ